MAYTLTQAEFVRLKSRLTRAVNTKDNDKIIAECDRALAIFEEKGFPDSWSNWERAKDDATFAKQRNFTGLPRPGLYLTLMTLKRPLEVASLYPSGCNGNTLGELR